MDSSEHDEARFRFGSGIVRLLCSALRVLQSLNDELFVPATASAAATAATAAAQDDRAVWHLVGFDLSVMDVAIRQMGRRGNYTTDDGDGDSCDPTGDGGCGGALADLQHAWRTFRQLAAAAFS